MKNNLILLTFIIVNVISTYDANCQDINNKTELIQNTRINLNDSIYLVFQVSSFDYTQHKIVRCDECGENDICLIDEKPVFGTDGGFPKTVLADLKLCIDTIIINLNTSAMYNVNGNNLLLSSDQFKLYTLNDRYILSGSFSDGAGHYIVEWLIIEATSLRIKIGYDN